MSKLAYCANEPTLLNLVSALMDFSTDMPVPFLPRVDYYRAYVKVASSTITL
jgi:hypothetical protein